MGVEYLKRAARSSTDDTGEVRSTVQKILDEIEAGGEETARAYAAEFDRYQGSIVLSRDEIDEAASKVSSRLKDDIRYAHDNVRRFAEAQKATIVDMEYEIEPGLIAGQKAIPCQAAGCYAPGGRYAHIASALMTVEGFVLFSGRYDGKLTVDRAIEPFDRPGFEREGRRPDGACGLCPAVDDVPIRVHGREEIVGARLAGNGLPPGRG